ncbi:SGT1 protein-domain-containing protein [Gongronella butleri]|nr:SGT1 protein-domain-containing protein [Gongronella butleri]
MASLAEIFGRHTVDQVNYLQYALYFPPHDSDQATKDALERLRSDILDFVRPWTHDHIWQKDGFNLAIVTSEQKDPSYPFLFGVSRFGDCLNDEWLLISLLYEVSRAYKDVVIALSDNDGEILLIEAAEQIPSWLDPSNSDNRVYIAGGQLHLIPLPTTPADIFATSASTHGNKKLRRADAIDYVRGRPKATLASPGVQDVLAQRLRGYPKKANEERHHARTLVYNRHAAYLLMQCPSLLCWAIDSFYLRDPVSLKACSTMKHFPLENPVDVVLPWTRTTYAQTVNQRFYAPPLFDKVLPRSNKDVDYDAAQLGMKLLCGLEMLACNAAKHPVPSNHNTDGASDVVDEALLLDRPSTLLPEDTTLTQWLENLNKGYSDAALAQLVDERAALPQDSTQWMDMVPDELEALLAHHNSSTNAAPPSADGMPVDLSNIMAKFEHFLETSQSDVGGVTLPG